MINQVYSGLENFVNDICLPYTLALHCELFIETLSDIYYGHSFFFGENEIWKRKINLQLTLVNSNLLLTQSEFFFPSGHFHCNLTLDNSSVVCQSSSVRQNILHNTDYFESIFE